VTETRYLDDEWAGRNISRKDIDAVLRSFVFDDMGPSKRGNDRLMFVGFDSSGRLLEAGVEYIDNEDVELVFHANDATPKYKKLYTRSRQ
jgi:hypothetical protein